MNTKLSRFASWAILAVAAPVSLAGAPADGSSFRESDAAAVESSYPREVEPAEAMEEIFVYGTAAVPHFEHEQLKAVMREQARRLNEQLKTFIRIELRQLAAPKLELASGPSQSAVGLPPA